MGTLLKKKKNLLKEKWIQSHLVLKKIEWSSNSLWKKDAKLLKKIIGFTLDHASEYVVCPHTHTHTHKFMISYQYINFLFMPQKISCKEALNKNWYIGSC